MAEVGAEPGSSAQSKKSNTSKTKQFIVGTAAIAITAIAAFFSIQSASGGEDIRSNMTLIAPAAAGGGWDTFQREQQQAMRVNNIVNNIQVVNIPGAGGTIGMGKLSTMTAPNTLMVGGTGHIAAQIQFDTPAKIQDITPIARVVEEFDIITVPANSPYNTLDELIEGWQADPAGVSWTGGGSFDQLVMTEIALAAGIDPKQTTFIPSDGGGEAIQALLNGTAKASTGGFADMYPQVEAGRLKVLGIAAGERLPGTDIPTLVEQGYDVTLTNWRAMFAPPGLSEEQITELREIVAESVATPEWQAAVERNYWMSAPLEGEELDQFVQEEIERIDQLFKEMG
ncbi:tripartite tricarboxylate transporter substrate binding protein TctC [Corynebacterium crudilactis]|uniref:Tricarboxylic transporter n=1 Tax=Corynebacterium crudilactis TaxID=1652495 RepID=A0A172QWG8_9CORY|nr:tripartite tricarboxylate transporter substrate binding protein TctC [Corynebacterium crudilactis]ANE04970.1 tricarboxylic transporter [Corynebacterium crudilactis]